jgi:tetratricopeptide (TPR) repeat protein
VSVMRWSAVVMVAVVALVACNDRGETDRVPLDRDAMAEARTGWSPEFGELIDNGNTAYRQGRYDDAAEAYRRATDLNPDVAAGWFGLHMAEMARGNEEAADEALMRAEALTPGLGGGHPTMPEGDSPHGGMMMPPHGEMPPGHPTRPQQDEGAGY